MGKDEQRQNWVLAISDERQVVDAVRACVRNANGVVVKSNLSSPAGCVKRLS